MSSESQPSHLDRARRVFELELAEAKKVCDRLDESFSEVVETIKKAVEDRAKVVVIGVGKSGHIGEKIAATLTSTGAPAVTLNALNAVHGDLGIISQGDVVLVLSYSGETEELVNVLPAIVRLDAKILSITGKRNSFLAKNSHVHLDVSVEREACPLELAPTSSTTAMLILGDAIAMALLEARGFTREDFAKFHPGGRIGRTLLLTVEQIMRPPDKMAFVSPDAIVRDVLIKMSRSRAGSAVAVDADGILAGIFTQGDFARHLSSNPNLLELPISGFLTRTPVKIEATALAYAVLHMLDHYKIDDLIVVDPDNRPVGMVDSQDLAHYRLL